MKTLDDLWDVIGDGMTKSLEVRCNRVFWGTQRDRDEVRLA